MEELNLCCGSDAPRSPLSAPGRVFGECRHAGEQAAVNRASLLNVGRGSLVAMRALDLYTVHGMASVRET